MKQKRIVMIFTAVAVLTVCRVHAAGTPVFDISNWYTALESLYSNYDMVMNTVTQIENQYRTIQQAVERAKTIDWDNIRFDGDFDIRDDIRDANRRVNRAITQARVIKETLNSDMIRLPGGAGYSLADLCGAGDEGKDFASAVGDVYGYMAKNMSDAADAMVSELTMEQKTAIMQKYGISPKNYWFVTQSVNLVKDAAAEALGKTTEQAKQMTRLQVEEEKNALLQAAYDQMDSEGNIPQATMNQTIMHLNAMVVDGLMSMREETQALASLQAKQMLAQQAAQETAAAEKAKRAALDEYVRKSVPDGFAAGYVEN